MERRYLKKHSIDWLRKGGLGMKVDCLQEQKRDDCNCLVGMHVHVALPLAGSG